MASLPTEGSLEERLKALQPGSWQQAFCGGGGKGSDKGGKQPGGSAGERPPGSPSLLLVSPSAIGAVNLIKLCPQFNKVRASWRISLLWPCGSSAAGTCRGRRALRTPCTRAGCG